MSLRQLHSSGRKNVDSGSAMIDLEKGPASLEDPMSVMIELPPEVEARLAALAEARGVPLPGYLRQLLEERVRIDNGGTLSPAERAAAWRESIKDLPHTPPL